MTAIRTERQELHSLALVEDRGRRSWITFPSLYISNTDVQTSDAANPLFGAPQKLKQRHSEVETGFIAFARHVFSITPIPSHMTKENNSNRILSSSTLEDTRSTCSFILGQLNILTKQHQLVLSSTYHSRYLPLRNDATYLSIAPILLVNSFYSPSTAHPLLPVK